MSMMFFDNDSVKTIGVCRVFEEIYVDSTPVVVQGKFPGQFFDSPVYQADGYEGQCARLTAWCEANNAHYYARPKEEFFVWEAREEAFRAGKPLVVLDNLS